MKLLTNIFFPKEGNVQEGSTPSLRSRIQSGGAFTLGGFGTAQILRLVSNLILTRLLVPEAFGLMAVAVSINIWAIMLTDIGIGTNIIRSRNSEDPAFLRTAWTIQILRNFVIWLIIVLAAVGIFFMAKGEFFRPESVFSTPMLPLVMGAISAQLLITGFSSINQFVAQRKLSMGRVVSLEIATQLFTMFVTISFALMGFGVWALVIGMLSGAIVNTTTSHFIFPGPGMRLQFKMAYASEIFHFGKWLIIASFFGFLVNRGDQILFGGLMESNQFGQYAVAAMWLVAGATVMETINSRVFFPAFSEILRERPKDITKAYRKARLLIDVVACVLGFGAFFLSEWVFSFIYSDSYSGVGHYLKLLSPFLLMAPFKLINTVILASGDSRNFTAVTVLAGSAVLIVTPTVYQYFGEKAAVVSFAAIEMVALPIIWRLGSKYLMLDPITELRSVFAIALLVTLIFTIG